MGHRELGIAELDLTPESPIMLAWYKADKAAIIPRTDHVLSPSSSSATGRRATNRQGVARRVLRLSSLKTHSRRSSSSSLRPTLLTI